MAFFNTFPRITYTLTDENGVEHTKTTTDLVTCVIFQKIVSSLNVPYLNYDVQDGERPDTVAAKYYGTSGYTWMVLLANDIFSQSDWPRSEREFHLHITKVYGSIAAAQSSIFAYKNAAGHFIDETTYNTLSDLERSAVSHYDHEVEHNETKRHIKLIDKTYLPAILNQFDALIAAR